MQPQTLSVAYAGTPPSNNSSTQATQWFDLRRLKEPFFFQVTVTGTIEIGVQIANDETVRTKSDGRTVASYTSSVAKYAPMPLPKFMRFIVNSVTGGSAVISVGRGVDENGKVVDIDPEALTTRNSDDFS